MLFLFVGMFLILGVSLVVAQGQGIHEPGTGLNDSELRDAGQGTGQGLEDGALGVGVGVRIRAGEYTGEKGERIMVQEKKNKQLRLEIDGVGVDCDCNLTQERVQNKTKLKVKLNNGRNAEVKIMPNTASEKALERLRLKNCVEADGCMIELKEVGSGEKVKLAYEVERERDSRVFGLFKARMEVRAQVDAESGEVIRVDKPWWAFLASEPSEE